MLGTLFVETRQLHSSCITVYITRPGCTLENVDYHMHSWGQGCCQALITNALCNQ